jgi:hypothetical protein
MKSTAKAQALLRDVADKLKVRYAPGAAGLNTVRQANDANGWPMLFLSHGGNEAAGQPVIGIRIQAVDAVSKDVFGNALIAFAPHTLEIAYELGASGNLTFVSHADLLIAEYESINTGVKILLEELANGTAVNEADMNTAMAAPTAQIENLYWPTKGV